MSTTTPGDMVNTLQPQSARAKTPHGTAILAIILASYFMILLDNSVIFTGLPSLEADLSLNPGQLSWVQDAYTLAFGGLLLLGARAGDLLGRKRVFIFGLAVFSIASLLIALAPNGTFLIASRGLQGVGAAILAPSSLSLITATFPAGPSRDRAVSAYAATAGIGASLGLVIGGGLAGAFSWRAGFLVNVPVGIAMIALAPRFLPETSRTRGRFDIAGAAAATLGVGAVVFGVIHAAVAAWTAPVTLGAIIAGVLILVGFVVNESRVEQPIMPLTLFADYGRTGAYLARLFYLGAMMGFFYFTTQYLQTVLGLSPLQAGLGFIPMTGVNFVVALMIPRLVRRVGESIPLVVGIALTLVGMLWLSRLGVASSYVTAVALPMALIGAGQGLAFAPLTSAGIAGASQADAGAASGLVNTFHQVGMALGLGVLVVVAEGSGMVTSASAGSALTAEVSAALTGASVFLVVSLVATLTMVVPGSRRRAATS